ncbi:FlhC family transcriptional regulator [Methylomicrobium sp. Wu6]|uniref:FlhC family transcriptional regulator n=1 Tax=Methylomicrobium sp. Wu6 TaxID=3107928 RepID=UPI002DD6A174|nr:FlhC family transcriptional regulator [Methylomicrobium sp. Wu6]MEC4747567.1 FlhC family transcriptional regulator [Methylomicrobium sp. Wu6]
MIMESHLRLTPKETDILGLKRKLDLAKGIIEKGGRPSIVRAVCQISKASALQFHKEIHGERAKAGQLPYDQDWIVKSPQNCLHASIYFNIFQSLSKIKHFKTTDTDRQNPKSAEIEAACKHATKGEIFLSSYTLYEQVVGEHPKVLSINRAWHIGQQVAMSYIGGMTCGRCNSNYVSIQNYPDIYKFCPLCDSATDTTGRQKWKAPNLNGSNKNANDIFSKYVFHSEAL